MMTESSAAAVSASPVLSTAGNQAVTHDDVRAQLRRMCECTLFTTSPRLREFLRFTVEQTLAGNAANLKEYLIGTTVFNKPESFDPRLDSIVRVEARRLRAKMLTYYRTRGADDEVRIAYQPGQYRPQFLSRQSADADGSGRPSLLIVGQNTAETAQVAQDLTKLGYQIAGITSSKQLAGQFLSGPQPSVVVSVAAAGVV